jgi:hypothetical protein
MQQFPSFANSLFAGKSTGEIKGLNAGVLYVSMKYILGTSSVQWSEVARLESKQLFLLRHKTARYTPAPLTQRTLRVAGRWKLRSQRLREKKR